MIYRKHMLVTGAFLAIAFLGRALVYATVPDALPVNNQELHKNVDADSTQDYDRDLLGDPTPKSKDNGTAKSSEQPKVPNEALPDRLRRELGAAAQAEKADKPAMVKVVEAMRDVQPRLAHRDAGETTQHIEDQIVSDLNRLVEEARKSHSSKQSSKGSRSKKPSESNSASERAAGNEKVAAPHENASRSSSEKRTSALPSTSENDTGDIRSLVKRGWGELPESERRQMLALPDEEFLPQYEEQTKQYLRRLSEGKSDEK